MPRVTAYSTESPFVPSPESQATNCNLPAHLAKCEKAISDAHRCMNIEPGTRVIVRMESGNHEATFQNAYRWPSDTSIVIAIVTIGDKTRKIEASRIGPIIRTKAAPDTPK